MSAVLVVMVLKAREARLSLSITSVVSSVSRRRVSGKPRLPSRRLSPGASVLRVVAMGVVSEARLGLWHRITGLVRKSVFMSREGWRMVHGIASETGNGAMLRGVGFGFRLRLGHGIASMMRSVFELRNFGRPGSREAVGASWHSPLVSRSRTAMSMLPRCPLGRIGLGLGLSLSGVNVALVLAFVVLAVPLAGVLVPSWLRNLLGDRGRGQGREGERAE